MEVRHRTQQQRQEESPEQVGSTEMEMLMFAQISKQHCFDFHQTLKECNRLPNLAFSFGCHLRIELKNRKITVPGEHEDSVLALGSWRAVCRKINFVFGCSS